MIIVELIPGIGILIFACLQYLMNRKLVHPKIEGIYEIFKKGDKTTLGIQILNTGFSNAILRGIVNEKKKPIAILTNNNQDKWHTWVLEKGGYKTGAFYIGNDILLKHLNNAKKLYVTDHTDKKHIIKKNKIKDTVIVN